MQTGGLELFRKFRHDLLNDLQILSGHIQLGRSQEELRRDLQTVVERIQEISYLFSCRSDPLALLFWSWLEQAKGMEVSISFELLQMETEPQERALIEVHDLVMALLPQICQLPEEDHWLHVRMEEIRTRPLLTLVTPRLPLELLPNILPNSLQHLPGSNGDEMKFAFDLN